MKVAYWPGCVSRGFTPELHGAMAAVAPLLDIDLIELDRANCCGAGGAGAGQCGGVGMKVAYWPGCVSRGFTPELHGSMAAIAPLLEDDPRRNGGLPKPRMVVPLDR